MKRPSELLKEVAHASDGGEIAIGDFVELLGDRSFTLIILVLSLPNSLPLFGLPGLSTVTGVPIFFMGLQIVWGRKVIWLPRRLAKKRFQQKKITKIIDKALPVVLWLEKFLRPRLAMLCESSGKKLIGLLIAVMAFILVLPILGGNFLPAVSICLLALALLEKDGLFALLGILFTLASFYLIYCMILVADNVLEWIADFM